MARNICPTTGAELRTFNLLKNSYFYEFLPRLSRCAKICWHLEKLNRASRKTSRLFHFCSISLREACRKLEGTNFPCGKRARSLRVQNVTRLYVKFQSPRGFSFLRPVLCLCTLLFTFFIPLRKKGPRSFESSHSNLKAHNFYDISFTCTRTIYSHSPQGI